MEVDTVIIRNMLVVMDILMEAMVTEVCVNTEEVTENMEDTEITDTNRMAKDTEVDMEVTETTNSEAMVDMEVTETTNS